MKCIVCGVEVRRCYDGVEDAPAQPDDPAVDMWHGGIVEWVSAGYGSRHDMNRYLICICDDCIDSEREPLPRTADNKPAYPGMQLYKLGLDDGILECHVDIRAYWINKYGWSLTDTVSNYFSKPQGS